MKNLIKNMWRIIPMLLVSVVIASCNDDDNATSSFFELSSNDLECNGNNIVDVIVPMEGQTYKLTVKSSVDVTWTTKCEGGSWLVATPVTKQSGDGEILIVASSNPTNIKNRTATVTIKNSINDEVYKYAFTQQYDPNQMVQKEDKYTCIYYNEERYNKEEATYAILVNKVDGNISITSLGQEDLNTYNDDNLTVYELLPTECYTLPKGINIDGEVEVKFINKEIGKLALNKEYMLPISISVGDRKTELIWLAVDVYKRNILRDVKEFDFYNANQDIISLLTISKEEGELTLAPITQEELEIHNYGFGTNYVSIPADYVIIPSGSVDFDESELSKDIEIIFKKEVGQLGVEEKEYVCGIRVYVDGLPLKEVFMKPHITTPVVTMDSKVYKHVLILNEGEKKASYDFNLYLDVINQWEFTVEFEKDETNLQGLVDQYNHANGVSYELLPTANCTLSSCEFTKEDNNKLVTAMLSGDGLMLGRNYLYPISPTKCSDDSPFRVEEKVAYVHVIVENKVNSIDDLPFITLTADMLKASGTDGGNVIGNLLKSDGSYWQSIWSPGGGKVDPKIDSKYGVYIDLDFSKQLLSQAFSINYQPRSWPNAVPNEIAVYAGTSKDDLKKVGGLKFDDNMLPFVKDTWIGRVDSEDKSKMSLFTLEESGVSLVRLSFLSSRDKTGSNNSVRDIVGFDWGKWTSGDYPCVALQQLKVYGK